MCFMKHTNKNTSPIHQMINITLIPNQWVDVSWEHIISTLIKMQTYSTKLKTKTYANKKYYTTLFTTHTILTQTTITTFSFHPTSTFFPSPPTPNTHTHAHTKHILFNHSLSLSLPRNTIYIHMQTSTFKNNYMHQRIQLSPSSTTTHHNTTQPIHTTT